MIDRKYSEDADAAPDCVCELLLTTEIPKIPEDYERYCSVRELYRRVTQLPISPISDIAILTVIEFLKEVHEFNNIEDFPVSAGPDLTTSG
jgi:hypothetical protein